MEAVEESAQTLGRRFGGARRIQSGRMFDQAKLIGDVALNILWPVRFPIKAQPQHRILQRFTLV